MSKRTIATAGIALLVVAGGGALAWRRLAASGPTPATRAGNALGHEGAPGTQRRWTIALTAELAQSDEARPVEVHLSGDWSQTVAAVRAHEVDIACELAVAKVTGGGQVAPPADQMEALRQRLSRRFWITYRDDGAALAAHFPKDIAPADRNLLLLVPTETQLVRASGEGAAWTAQERDGAGLYIAAYQREDAGHLAKRKLRYSEVDAAGAVGGGVRGLSVDVDGSEARFTLDRAGRVAAFDGTDRVRIALPGPGGNRLAMSTTIHLADARDASVADAADSLARAAGTVDDTPIRTQQVDPEVLARLRDQRLLVGHTADGLFAEAASPKPDKLLGARLAALFRSQPETVDEAAQLAREGTASKLLFGALAGAQTPPALAALNAAAHDAALPSATRVAAVSALVVVTHPPAASLRMVLDLCDDGDTKLRRAACLMSASLSHDGRADHPAEAAAIDAALAERYGKATDLARRVELLEAMGNSAGPSLVPLLAAALHAGPTPARAAAARSLRLAEAPETDELLLATIASDRDPAVRDAALFAARYRPFNRYVEAVVRAAESDPEEYVRSAAVGLLAAHLGAAPPDTRIRETLAHVAEHDPKPGVRKLARNALSGSPSGSASASATP